MNFICDPCKNAADMFSGQSLLLLDLKRKGHQNCKGGTWCDCAHRVKRV